MLFHDSPSHTIENRCLRIETTFNDNLGPAFGDAVFSDIRGRNRLRLRVESRYQFLQVMTCSLGKARAYIALRQLLATILRQHVGCHMCGHTDAC